MEMEGAEGKRGEFSMAMAALNLAFLWRGGMLINILAVLSNITELYSPQFLCYSPGWP